MFKVNTPTGEKYMVQLVGPNSYRMGALMVYRGQTITVEKRTRDYLVRKTRGAFVDFDPTPAEPIEEIMPPQFGQERGTLIDMNDIDPKSNPPMSMEHAIQLAGSSGAEVPTHTVTSAGVGIDTSDLEQAPQGATASSDGSGDMTGADLKKGAQKATGGATAAKAAGVKITTKATPAGNPAQAGATVVD